MAFTVRPFRPDDAAAADLLLREAFADQGEAREAVAAGTLRLSQTGSRLLVAEDELGLAGLVRWWDDDGIAWADLLVAAVPGAGRELVRAVERAAQDRGLRVLRGAVDEATGLPDYLGRLGYLPVARRPGPPPALIVEKRLPLLTVREQRRSDAAVLAELTGEDPYVFDMGTRPGWFVLADGDRVCGVVSARTGRDGVARISRPIVAPGYERRGLELWMIDRAALYAATAGCHTARVPAVPALERIERDLEAHQWRHDGGDFVRDLATIPLGLD
jgi:predicted N-acetyltransferase YhbS